MPLTEVEFPFLTVYEVEILKSDHAMFDSEIEDKPRALFDSRTVIV